MHKIYEIGPFRLDAWGGVLSCGDAPAALGPRGVAVLKVLAERAHEFVAKQDIIDIAWQGVCVDDSNLATQISAIRKVLAQAPDGNRWIETLARRGYRFVGPVKAVSGYGTPGRKPARSADDGESEWARRFIAFLHVRFVRSPEVDNARALNAVFDCVQRFGGQVELASTTELLAAFGLEPVDNAPYHAALAALAAHRAAALASSDPGQAVALMISISGGHHQVRAHNGRFERAEQGRGSEQTGHAELQALSRPGATLITAAVAPFLRRHFGLQSISETGRGVWQLLPHQETSLPRSPLIGRARELATLAQAATLAAQGQSQIIGIVGEAGVGKSRLINELARQLLGWRLLHGGCAVYTVNTSYAPFAQVLQRYFQTQDCGQPQEVRKKVSDALPRKAGEPAWLLPALFDVLDVLPAADTFFSLDPAVRRRRTHDALRQFFVAASEIQPLCLMIEDLHWVDGASREVLDSLVNGMMTARILMLTSYRPEYQHAWSHKASFRQVRLDVLAPDQGAEMFDALCGTDSSLAPVKQQLAGQGNPFHLEETLRNLLETGTLVGRAGAYRLAHAPAGLGPGELQVPATVQAILSARVMRLPAQERWLLQLASAIGRNVAFELLQATTGLPEEPLRGGLETLEAAEFLYQTGFHPKLEYTFQHALTQEVAYATIPEDQRCLLHARIVQCLESTYPVQRGEFTEVLAHHAVQAQQWEAASDYLQRAGKKAMARSDNRDAVYYFEQALAALSHCPDRHALLERAIDLHFDLKAVLLPLGAFAQVHAHLHDAEGLIQQLGDTRRLGQFCVHMCQIYQLSGNPLKAIEFGERAESIADQLGDLALQISGATPLGLARFATLDYPRAEHLFLKVLKLLEGQQNQEHYGLTGYPAVNACSYLARVCSDQGRFAQGVLYGEEGIERAQALDHPYSLSTALWCLADLQIRRGAFEPALALLERGLAVARQWQLRFLEAGHLGSLGYAQAMLGQSDHGLPLLEQALQIFDAMGHRFGQSLFLVPLGEALSRNGRNAEALLHANRSLALARDGGQRAGEAGALRLLGDLSAHADADIAAEQHYRDALSIAQAFKLRPLIAHCHRGLGQLRGRRGQADDPQEHGATAIRMYREMGMHHWLG